MDSPERKLIRLRKYDYSQNGYYFITICTQGKRYILCKAKHCLSDCNHQFELSDAGALTDTAIRNIPFYYPGAVIDKYVIMPNHIHMIIAMSGGVNGRTLFAPTISRIIKQMKGYITKEIGHTVWQKSYYDHVIRCESDYQEIWNYIENNPLKWELDKYYIKL